MATLVLTGAGNVELTRRILSDLFVVPELTGTLRVVLHDIDRERLDTARVLADRLNAEAGAAAAIEAHQDRRTALDGADFVVCQLSVGGFEATLRDFEIPARHGLRQTIADTIGIGGIFCGLRTIPVLVDIARDMTELCPDAWLLSYTDPLVMALWAAREATGLRRIAGLCHAVRDTHAYLADAVGREAEDVAFRTAGLPHQAFVLEFREASADGRSLYPDFADAVAADPRLARHVRTEMWRRFGYFPTESSEHAAEYVPWFMSRDEEVKRLGIPVGEYLGRVGQSLHIYEEIRRGLASGRSMLSRWQDPEIASEVLTAMLIGEPRRINLTVPNAGLLPALPADCFVEVPTTVAGRDLRPEPIPDYPAQLAALNRTYVNVAELTVRAALDGAPDHVRHAAMLDPNTAATLPLTAIADLCDEMTEAHRDLLPAALALPPARKGGA